LQIVSYDMFLGSEPSDYDFSLLRSDFR
jgi:hypothetical protein